MKSMIVVRGGWLYGKTSNKISEKIQLKSDIDDWSKVRVRLSCRVHQPVSLGDRPSASNNYSTQKVL